MMQNIDKDDILKLVPFNVNLYKNISLTSLTAYSIYWLSEWGIATSYENISVVNSKLFPGKFSMVGWSQFPDAFRTNRSLLQMRPKYRNLAYSAADKGVFLNDNGLKEAKALINSLGAPTISDKEISFSRVERGRGKSWSVHPEDAIKKIKQSRIYNLFKEGMFESTEAIHLISLLGVYDHTPSKEKKRKLKELIDFSKEINDKEVFGFLIQAQKKFEKYLNK